MDIYRLAALSDNYIFLLHDPVSQTAAVVDPAVAPPVLQQLNQLGATLTMILNTHHHGDHVGGNRDLLRQFPQARVYASQVDCDRIPGQHEYLKAGDTLTVANRTAHILFVPGHTRGHIAYYFPADDHHPNGDLFCGDTLFAGGCGRLFEGTPAQMLQSLQQIRALPDHTQIWCAHEYTLNNLHFALTVEPNNPQLRHRLITTQTARQQGQPTIPSLLSLEKQTNPFLRWDQPALQQHTPSGVSTFAHLRALKDRF